MTMQGMPLGAEGPQMYRPGADEQWRGPDPTTAREPSIVSALNDLSTELDGLLTVIDTLQTALGKVLKDALPEGVAEVPGDDPTVDPRVSELRSGIEFMRNRASSATRQLQGIIARLDLEA